MSWTDETDDLDWYPFYIRLSASIRVLLHYIPAINNTPIPMFFTQEHIPGLCYYTHAIVAGKHFN